LDHSGSDIERIEKREKVMFHWQVLRVRKPDGSTFLMPDPFPLCRRGQEWSDSIASRRIPLVGVEQNVSKKSEETFREFTHRVESLCGR